MRTRSVMLVSALHSLVRCQCAFLLFLRTLLMSRQLRVRHTSLACFRDKRGWGRATYIPPLSGWWWPPMSIIMHLWLSAHFITRIGRGHTERRGLHVMDSTSHFMRMRMRMRMRRSRREGLGREWGRWWLVAASESHDVILQLLLLADERVVVVLEIALLLSELLVDALAVSPLLNGFFILHAGHFFMHAQSERVVLLLLELAHLLFRLLHAVLEVGFFSQLPFLFRQVALDLPPQSIFLLDLSL